MIFVWFIEKCKGAVYRFKRLTKFLKGYLKAGTEGFIPINGIDKKPKDKIWIACRMTGGFGDYIIASKFVDELKEYGPCMIDVYCEKILFGEAVFGQREDVRVMPAPGYYGRLAQYDLSIVVEHFIHVGAYHAYRLAKLAPVLYEKVRKLEKDWKELYVPIEEQCYREAIHFARCEKLGIDRWSEMRMGGIFHIENKKTFIPLLEEYRKRFTELGLDNVEYITVNYGSDAMGRRDRQIKMWPFEYYDKFIALFKTEFPQIRVVQLGTENTPHMEKADIYVMGESLETVKWVLKNSRIHLDCEGGLVHLATQFDTKCVVVFGPTPCHMYGYEQNINLVSSRCSNCMGYTPNWAFECSRGLDEPECIYDITPEVVMWHIEEYLKG